jgi:hypothetical protein
LNDTPTAKIVVRIEGSTSLINLIQVPIISNI